MSELSSNKCNFETIVVIFTSEIKEKKTVMCQTGSGMYMNLLNTWIGYKISTPLQWHVNQPLLHLSRHNIIGKYYQGHHEDIGKNFNFLKTH